MRAAALALVAVAVLLGAARLFTGLVYGADEPVSYFVFKASPDPAIERTETAARPVSGEHILARGELSLPLSSPYIAIMRAAPAAAAASLVVAAILLWARRGRRRSGPTV